MNQSKSTTDSTQQTSPWGPQATALTSAFSNAQNAYGKSSSAVAPTDFTAQMTPEQLATFRSMTGYGGNSAIPGSEAAAGSSLMDSGVSGATGALSRLGAFNPSATNNPGAIASGANTYADGLNIPGAVQAAMRDATQEARDVTLPGMESSAAGTGNINGSRTGIAEGLVQRGLAEKAGDLSATMRNDAYTTGAGLTAGALTNNNAQALEAASGAGALGSSMATGGAGLGSNSINDQGNLFTLANAGGAGIQQNNQLDLTNLLQRYQSQTNSPYDALNGLMGIIGSNNWGSNSTGQSTTTSTPSAFQTIGGLMYGLGGLTRSDRNTKDKIEQIGTLFDGTPVYRFQYIGNRRVHIGLMAQDVEKTRPEAVQSVEGVKYVNYDTATRDLVKK